METNNSVCSAFLTLLCFQANGAQRPVGVGKRDPSQVIPAAFCCPPVAQTCSHFTSQPGGGFAPLGIYANPIEIKEWERHLKKSRDIVVESCFAVFWGRGVRGVSEEIYEFYETLWRLCLFSVGAAAKRKGNASVCQIWGPRGSQTWAHAVLG